MPPEECRCLEVPGPPGSGLYCFQDQIDRDTFCDYDREAARAACEEHLTTHPECQICECTAWVDAECVGDGLRRQVRTCTPAGCAAEERTIPDPTCAAPPPTYSLTLTVDKSSGLPGDIFNFEGYLTSDGVGVEGAIIEVYLQGETTPFARSVTDVNGRYTATWIAIEQGTFYFQSYYPTEGILSNQEVIVIEAQIYAALTITSTAGGITNPAVGTHTYLIGDVVTVLATSEPSFHFHHWELDGVDMGSQNPIEITMDRDYTLHAVFSTEPPGPPLSKKLLLGLVAGGVIGGLLIFLARGLK